MTDDSLLSQIKQAENKFEQGHTKEAIQDFLDLNDKSPDNPQILNNLGVISYTLGYLNEAYGYFKKAISADPKYQQAYVKSGNQLFRS